MNKNFEQVIEDDRAMIFKAQIILANSGDPDSQNIIGHCYEDGDGVQQDFGKALEWHKLAAQRGNFDSAFRIGRIYHFGLGVEQRFSDAVEWYGIASNGNHDLAKVNLGLLYINGKVPKLIWDFYISMAKELLKITKLLKIFLGKLPKKESTTHKITWAQCTQWD